MESLKLSLGIQLIYYHFTELGYMYPRRSHQINILFSQVNSHEYWLHSPSFIQDE